MSYITCPSSSTKKLVPFPYDRNLIGKTAHWKHQLVEIYELYNEETLQVSVRDYFNKIHLGYPMIEYLEFDMSPPSNDDKNNSSAVFYIINDESIRKMVTEIRKVETCISKPNNNNNYVRSMEELKNDPIIRENAKADLMRQRGMRDQVREFLREDDDLRQEVKDELREDDDLRQEVKDELREDDDLRQEVKDELREDDDLREEVKDELREDDDLREEVKDELREDDDLREKAKEQLREDLKDELRRNNDLHP